MAAIRVALLFALFLSVACAQEITGSRRELLGGFKRKSVHYIDWRAPHPPQMDVNLTDIIQIKWLKGPRTGIIQFDYPGLCTNGTAQNPLKKPVGVKVLRGKLNSKPTAEGMVELQATAAGSVFFTSPVSGQCDARWLRINALAPVGRRGR